MPVTRGCAFARRGGADRVFLLPPQVEREREKLCLFLLLHYTGEPYVLRCVCVELPYKASQQGRAFRRGSLTRAPDPGGK